MYVNLFKSLLSVLLPKNVLFKDVGAILSYVVIKKDSICTPKSLLEGRSLTFIDTN